MQKILYVLAMMLGFGACALAERASHSLMQQQVDQYLQAEDTERVINLLTQLAQSGAEDFQDVLNDVVAKKPALSMPIIDALKAIDPGLAVQALASVVLMLEDMGENRLAADLGAHNQDLIDFMKGNSIQPAAGTAADEDVSAGERGFGKENPNQQEGIVSDGDEVEAPVTLF